MDDQGDQVEHRKVKLVPHNPHWQKMAEKEASRIQAVLPDQVLVVHHIGSTSIPGIKAKPILDFVVVVRDLSALEKKDSRLEELGYQAQGERGIPGRRFYSKDTHGSRSHHLHAFPAGHSEIERHLLFRDYLRAHPEAAGEYERLKEKLARRFPDKSGCYTEAKSDFIFSMDEQARSWNQQQENSQDE